MSKTKITIVDTNVFLHDPQVLNKLINQVIIIPLAVIEELDKFKKDQAEIGRNARWVIKAIDKIIEAQEDQKSISNAGKDNDPSTFGVPLENNARLMIELNHIDTVKSLDSSKNDNRILSVAKYFANKFPNHDVSLISMDAALRIKAASNSVKTLNYQSDDVKHLESADDQYSGVKTIKCSDEELRTFRREKRLKTKEVLNANEYVIMQDKDNHEIFQLGRYSKKDLAIVSLIDMNNLWGISPKNLEQNFAVDALLNPDIPLVTLSGKAGTGKTLLSVAAGLFQSLDQANYKKMLISRPVVPLGKDIGYLPGDLNEKMNPYMQSIFDNLEFLMSNNGGSKNSAHRYRELIEQGLIQVEALTYIRGRSIPEQFFVIDESQNLTKHEIKTIASRAGMGTKIIFTGDPDQIDNPYLDKLSNGLSVLIESLKDEELSAHVTLTQGERSPLAEMIVEKLK